MTRPEQDSQWRLLFREGDLPAGSIGWVTDPCNKAGEVVLAFPEGEISFELDEFYEACQQPAREPSIGELSEAHNVLGHDAIELAHDIWCRDTQMSRAHAAQGSTRALLLVAYPALRERILMEDMGDPIEARAPHTSYYDPEEDAQWEHFVCEVCGEVRKLPWSGGKTKETSEEKLPMCSHGGNYIWPFDRSVAQLEENGYVQMKIADIRVRDEVS